MNIKSAIPRKFFGRRKELIEPPHLIKIPVESFENFIQFNSNPTKRKDVGLEYIFKTSFPFYTDTLKIEYLGYEIGDWECINPKCDFKSSNDILGGQDTYCPKCGHKLFYKEKYSPDECKTKGLTYAAPLRVMVRLIKKTKKGEKLENAKKIYFGEIPLMTPWGTFIINGIERVVVTQLIRSPGVFFEEKEDRQKVGSTAKSVYRASIIPDKGSRIEFELSSTDILTAKVDKKKVSPISLLRAFGAETAYEILSQFYDGTVALGVKKGELYNKITGEIYKLEDLENYHIFAVLRYKAKHENIGKEEEWIEERYIEDLAHLEKLLQDEKITIDLISAVSNESTTKSIYSKIVLDALISDTQPKDSSKRSQVKIYSSFSFKDYGLMEIYRRLRLVETMSIEIPDLVDRSRSYFEVFFKDISRYDLSRVGRVKINAKVYNYKKTLSKKDLDIFEELPMLELTKDYDEYKAGTVLTKEILQKLSKTYDEIEVKDYTEQEARFLNAKDLVNSIKFLIKVRFNKEKKDDIAHLGNRRIRAIGELLENQARIGITRMEKAFKDKASIANADDPNLKVQDLLNPRYLTASISEFLKGGQLSQYLDNANPLSSLTHRRRLSALGPGGLTRESAKFEIRDVHPSHYGRLCPIETPEGQNIGLVTSITTYAMTNEYGFLITPYRKVENGIVKDKIEFLAAYEEENFVIAQSSPIDENGKILSERVLVRYKNDIQLRKPHEVNYIDVSPKQVISVSASLIPFLEHDDANRALMGSNMQRQAVPLVYTEYPLVGTGMEKRVAKDSNSLVLCKRSGIVEYVDASKIIIKVDESQIDEENIFDIGIDTYELKKFEKTNQNTSVNQRPLVKKGDRVNKGDIIADGQSTYKGELALGKNVLVAFMPWRGYNFEDAIVISERLVKEDVFTSVHIEEFEIEARETKIGDEEITRSIPGALEKHLAHLDEHGIVKIGTYVKPGDILVGKVSPKGETQLTPEEKLLQAIFGEKTRDVKDSSLRCPVGVEGVVIGTQVFTRRSNESTEKRNSLANKIDNEEEERLIKERESKKNFVEKNKFNVLYNLVIGKALDKEVKLSKKTYEKGTKIDDQAFEALKNLILSKPENIFEDKELIDKINAVKERAKLQINLIDKTYDELRKNIGKKSDLPPGVITLVKVYVAQKRKIKVGDKMAGRHGNKGVISVILPVEDMPFLEDGTPVDIVLNPLGVPSRMNVGQILETHIGWACKELGKKIGEFLDEDLENELIRKELVDYITQIYSIGDKDGENEKFVREFLNSLSTEKLYEVIKDYERIGLPIAAPSFESPKEDYIREMLKKAGLPETGKTILYDGRTGEPFDLEVTVGYMFMLKLIHMVDDKIHARSTGPYSLVTQQPLGGRAQFGGQRLGEMEVWALEAHGAAYTLQEMLTVKSDDIEGRSKVYESIVKGKYFYNAGIPESFRVLVRELKALNLNVKCENGESRSCDSIKLEEEENK